MTIEKYLYCFRMLAHSINSDMEILNLYRRSKITFLSDCLSVKSSFSSEDMDTVAKILFDEDLFRMKLDKKKRLYNRFLLRLSRAINDIRDDRYRDFLVLHYIYDIPAEEIAERKHYAERSMYRIGKSARGELFNSVKKISPKPKRSEKHSRYRITRRKVLLCCSNRVCSGRTRRAVLGAS